MWGTSLFSVAAIAGNELLREGGRERGREGGHVPCCCHPCSRKGSAGTRRRQGGRDCLCRGLGREGGREGGTDGRRNNMPENYEPTHSSLDFMFL